MLVAFIVLAIAWRLPATVNALARDPGVAVAEMVTLIGGGSGLWLELVGSRPLLPRLSRPQRAVMAAVAMWTIWVLAYIMGMSKVAWFAAYSHAAGDGLGTAADQQVAVGILWAVPALCFAPVIYGVLMAWLRDSQDPDEELRSAVRTLPMPGSAAGRVRRGAGSHRRRDHRSSREARAGAIVTAAAGAVRCTFCSCLSPAPAALNRGLHGLEHPQPSCRGTLGRGDARGRCRDGWADAGGPGRADAQPGHVRWARRTTSCSLAYCPAADTGLLPGTDANPH